MLRPDRRTALKAQNRSAILAAARSLIAEGGGPGFSVDDLAARADVARRTVFNHFDSLDEVLLAVGVEALQVVVDDFLASVAGTAVGDGSRSAMFDELATALHASDLPDAIASMLTATGGAQALRDRADLTRAAFAQVGHRLQDEVVRRHPGADGLDVELLVGSLMNGVVLIAERWVDETGGMLDSASRAAWDRLLSRVLRSLRSGYMPT